MLFLFSAEKKKYAMRIKCVPTVSVKVKEPVPGYQFLSFTITFLMTIICLLKVYLSNFV